MKVTLSTRALIGILFIIFALVGTPIAIFQLQQQQELRQHADTTVAWSTDQGASTSCPANGSSAIITVTFSNTEPNTKSLSMDVSVVDRQTNKSVSLGSIPGGQTKSGIIQTGKSTLSAGTVDFALTWTDKHSGSDSRTATYKAVTNCYPPVPTATPTPKVTPAPSPKPSIKPSPSPYPSKAITPTVCPTLGPVKNVKIDCPNCPK